MTRAVFCAGGGGGGECKKTEHLDRSLPYGGFREKHGRPRSSGHASINARGDGRLDA